MDSVPHYPHVHQRGDGGGESGMRAHQKGTLMGALREKTMEATTCERLLPQCVCPLGDSVVKLLVADLGPLLVSIARN